MNYNIFNEKLNEILQNINQLIRSTNKKIIIQKQFKELKQYIIIKCNQV